MDMQFNRSELLLGASGMQALSERRVLLVGVGGVGSWCAESLIRTGLLHLTIVDADKVAPSNLNRQLMATTKTIGMPKVQALRERLLEINPEADITAQECLFSKATSEQFHLEDYDYIIDCIDSLQDKVDLLVLATQTKARVFSSMGAACKVDPRRIQVAEFWKVTGCPLGAALRNRIRKSQQRLAQKVLCVFSEERIPNQAIEQESDGSMTFHKVQTNGSLPHITAIYGFTLAGLVVQDIIVDS